MFDRCECVNIGGCPFGFPSNKPKKGALKKHVRPCSGLPASKPKEREDWPRPTACQDEPDRLQLPAERRAGDFEAGDAQPKAAEIGGD